MQLSANCLLTINFLFLLKKKKVIDPKLLNNSICCTAQLSKTLPLSSTVWPCSFSHIPINASVKLFLNDFSRPSQLASRADTLAQPQRMRTSSCRSHGVSAQTSTLSFSKPWIPWAHLQDISSTQASNWLMGHCVSGCVHMYSKHYTLSMDTRKRR